MLTFLALYRGRRLGDCQTLTMTTDKKIIRDFAEALLKQKNKMKDPAVQSVADGERKALEAILKECR